MSIAEKARHLYDYNDNDGLFRMARETWPPIQDALPEGIGEVYRFAYTRARQTRQPIEGELWRARAMVAAVIAGARETARARRGARVEVALREDLP